MKFIPFMIVLALATPVLANSETKERVDSCITCHDLLDDEAATKWSKNIHALSGMKCVDCHGGDASQGDMDLAKTPQSGFVGIPKVQSIPGLCGECHVREAQLFLASPMAVPLQTGRMLACVSCHKGHRIQKMPWGQPGPICKECHEPTDPGMVLAKTYTLSFSKIHGKIVDLENAVKDLHKKGMNAEKAHDELEKAKEVLKMARVLLHGFASPTLQKIFSQASTQLKTAEQETLKVQDRYNQRRKGLLISCILLFIFTLFLGWKIRSLPLKEKQEDE